MKNEHVESPNDEAGLGANIRGSGRAMTFQFARRFLLFIGFAFSLAACSEFKVLYALTGDAIERQATFYLLLDETEEAALERRVEAVVEWHRTRMLPRYAAYLIDVSDTVERDRVDRVAVVAAISEARTLLAETVRGASPFIAAVLADHTGPEKRSHIQARMGERQAERESESNLPRDELIEMRTQKAVSRFERVFGDLDQRQVRIVEAYFQDTIDSAPSWQRVRSERRQAFLTFLADDPDQARIAAFIPQIILRSEVLIGPRYREMADLWWARFTRLMVGMIGSLSSEQRQHFVTVMRKYAADMNDLSS